jgi:hypothetical protein
VLVVLCLHLLVEFFDFGIVGVACKGFLRVVVDCTQVCIQCRFLLVHSVADSEAGFPVAWLVIEHLLTLVDDYVVFA